MSEAKVKLSRGASKRLRKDLWNSIGHELMSLIYGSMRGRPSVADSLDLVATETALYDKAVKSGEYND